MEMLKLYFRHHFSFANDPCVGSTKNGTCYTAEECSDRSGVNSGSCAGGYGVCCVCEDEYNYYKNKV